MKALDSNGNEGSDSIDIKVGDEEAGIQMNQYLGWLWPVQVSRQSVVG